MGAERRRLLYLDSIRGLAALIVVTSHLAFTSHDLSFLDTTGVKLLRASGFAVALFFVLSGFVLFRQIQVDRPSYLGFLVRRIFRLFPPCIVAVSASYALYMFWHPAPVPRLTQWFNIVSWPPGITLDQYLMHLTLTGDDGLLKPIWSLVIEWRISLIFPFIVTAFLLFPRASAVIAFGTVLALAKTNIWQETRLAWVCYTAFYGALFVAGIAIARYELEIADFLGRRRYLRYAMLAIVVYWTDLRSQQTGLIGVFYVGIAAAIFIAAAVSDPALQRVMETRPLLFLGRISYSLYLSHLILIGVLFRIMDGTNPLIIAAITILCSIATATIMQKFIEKPFIKLGRLSSTYMSTARG